MNEIMHNPEAFFLENFNTDKIFTVVERADYPFLYYIKTCADENGRTYLSALSEAMKMEIPALSRQIERLQGKGYVIWQTDHTAGRTYVQLSSKAVELMYEERRRMSEGYEKILEEIGPEELERTVRTMRKISRILNGSITG